MNQKTQRHSVSGLFSLLLLLLFAFSTLSLVLLGSRIYQNGVAHLDRNFTTRTAVAYVTEKLHQHEETGNISIKELDGCPALFMEDSIEGDRFYTYIYFYDGALRELFIRKNVTPSADLGSRVVALGDFSFSAIPGRADFLSFSATDEEGHSLSATIHLSADLVM